MQISNNGGNRSVPNKGARTANGPSRMRIARGPSAALVRPLKTAEEIARQIVDYVVDKDAQPGDRLPTESEMAADWGVSRQSVREALRLLEVQGLISLRRGFNGGPVVEYVDPVNLGRMSTLYYHLAGATEEELLGAWMFAQRSLTDLAARNPRGDERRRAMAPFVSHAEPDYSAVPGLDGHGAFHSIVASLADNRVLEILLQSPGSIFWSNVMSSKVPLTERSVLADHHGEIARAISDGSPNKASSLMQDHVSYVAARYRENPAVDTQNLLSWC